MRHKEYDRINRMFNIDRDLDEWLRKKYPGLASNMVNDWIRSNKDKEEKKVIDLIGSDTNAGRLAYIQAMEKINYLHNTDWKILDDKSKKKFLEIYKIRLGDLQARGF